MKQFLEQTYREWMEIKENRPDDLNLFTLASSNKLTGKLIEIVKRRNVDRKEYIADCVLVGFPEGLELILDEIGMTREEMAGDEPAAKALRWLMSVSMMSYCYSGQIFALAYLDLDEATETALMTAYQKFLDQIQEPRR